MKTKKNEIALLIGLAGVAIAVAVYVWVFNPYRDKTEVVKADNAAQQEYLNKLEEWNKKKDVLLEDTTAMIEDVNEKFARFPVQSKAEDAIMYAVELESQDPDTFISSIGLSQPELCYEAQPTTVKLKETDEESSHTYQLYNQKINFTQQFTYDGMKRYVNSIVKDTRRRAIDTLSMSYDSSSGILVGTTTMNLYTLSGTEDEYQKTSIPPMPMGTSDIFASLDKSGFAPIVEQPERTEQTE